jgi:peptidoglycan/LPS O-acetylase OafA/YrhL
MTPLGLLFSGTSAVDFFFVLSGFVLNLAYAQAQEYRPGWWAEFIVKRVFRIYPAYIAAILLAVMLKLGGAGEHSAYSRIMLRDWYGAYWNEPFTVVQAAKTLAMAISVPDARIFDAPAWSLLIEMRISVIFPLVILVVNRKRSLTADLLLLAATYVACFQIASICRITTVFQLPQFVGGALLAKRWSEIAVAMLRMPRREWDTWKASLLLGSTILCCLGAMVIAADEGAGHFQIDLLQDYCGEQLVAIGSAGLIVLSMYSVVAKRILSSAVLGFMGRTSYSFYLVHLLVLLAVVRIWISVAGHAPMVPVAIVALIGSYILANLMSRFVEMPCNEFGRTVAGKVSSAPAAGPS